MDCTICRELMDAYQDGELSDSQLTVWEQHIHLCVDCRKEMEENERLWNLIASSSRIQPGDSFRPSLLSHIKRPETAPNIRMYARRSLAIWASFAAVVLFAVIGMILYPSYWNASQPTLTALEHQEEIAFHRFVDELNEDTYIFDLNYLAGIEPISLDQ